MLTDCVSVEFFKRSYLLSLDLISFHCAACMPATPMPGAGLAAEKLRWGKYSAIYQRRLLEGGRSLEAFLHEAGLDWTIIKREKARRVDEILEQYIQTAWNSIKPGKSRGLQASGHLCRFLFLQPWFARHGFCAEQSRPRKGLMARFCHFADGGIFWHAQAR